MSSATMAVSLPHTIRVSSAKAPWLVKKEDGWLYCALCSHHATEGHLISEKHVTRATTAFEREWWVTGGPEGWRCLRRPDGTCQVRGRDFAAAPRAGSDEETGGASASPPGLDLQQPRPPPGPPPACSECLKLKARVEELEAGMSLLRDQVSFVAKRAGVPDSEFQ